MEIPQKDTRPKLGNILDTCTVLALPNPDGDGWVCGFCGMEFGNVLDPDHDCRRRD